MKAPITLLPQMSAPSLNRQIGAVRNAGCHRSQSAVREDDIAPCSHGSHALRNSRGAPMAMKSRLAGTLPYRLHCIALHPSVAGHLKSVNSRGSNGLTVV